MDDTSIKESLSGFEEVWRRVGGSDGNGGMADTGEVGTEPGGVAGGAAGAEQGRVWTEPGRTERSGGLGAGSGDILFGAPGERERLRAFMVSAAGAAALYSSLARRFKGPSAVLSRLAGEEREHLRALGLEYYLLTGDSFVPETGGSGGGRLLELLRWAWQAEGRSEASYLNAAAISPLGPLYRRHAENERRHRETVRALIARALGGF